MLQPCIAKKKILDDDTLSLTPDVKVKQNDFLIYGIYFFNLSS